MKRNVLKNWNKNSMRLAIIVGIALLAMPLVSAALSDSFARVFIKIDGFFTGQAYKPYAKTIDFVFFTLFFIAFYVQVIKYAFKENTKPVKFIAVLLGLMSGFLLTAGGYSVQKLIPYIPWLIYFLLAALIYRLLTAMGMQSKFWRLFWSFLLAALLLWLMSQLLFPQNNQLSTFFDNVGRIDLPAISSPGSGFAPPTSGGGAGNANIPVTLEGGGWDWGSISLATIGGLLGLYILYKLIGAGMRRWQNRDRNKKEIRGQVQEAQKNVSETLLEFAQELKKGAGKLVAAYRKREDYLKSEDKRIAFLNAMQKEDKANLFSDQGRFIIKEEHKEIAEMMKAENEVIDALKHIVAKEIQLYETLQQWKRSNTFQGLDKQAPKFEKLENDIVANKPTGEWPGGVGALYLTQMLANIEQPLTLAEKKIEELLNEKKIEDLVKGKFTNLQDDQQKLKKFSQGENRLLVNLLGKLKEQYIIMEELAKEISWQQKNGVQKTQETVLRELNQFVGFLKAWANLNTPTKERLCAWAESKLLTLVWQITQGRYEQHRYWLMNQLSEERTNLMIEAKKEQKQNGEVSKEMRGMLEKLEESLNELQTPVAKGEKGQQQNESQTFKNKAKWPEGFKAGIPVMPISDPTGNYEGMSQLLGEGSLGRWQEKE